MAVEPLDTFLEETRPTKKEDHQLARERPRVYRNLADSYGGPGHTSHDHIGSRDWDYLFYPVSFLCSIFFFGFD